ncbi:MAG: septum formation family protein [Microthrixaceae bacterium]
MFVVLAGCAPSGGGCEPIDAGPTTTAPGETTTTTETTVPVGGEGSTTTTPGGSTSSTLPDGSSTTSTVPPTTVPGTGELVSVESLEPGDCVTPSADQDALREVPVADCAAAHGVETFAVLEIDETDFPDVTDDAYPGGADLRDVAYQACQTPFATYVGVPFWESSYDITTITPSPSSWVAGDREIVCLIVDMDGNLLTGSARDRAR